MAYWYGVNTKFIECYTHTHTHTHTPCFIDSSNLPHSSEYKICHYKYNVSTFMSFFLLISTGQEKGQISAQD